MAFLKMCFKDLTKMTLSNAILIWGNSTLSIFSQTFPKYLILIPCRWKMLSTELESDNFPLSELTSRSLIKLGIAFSMI